MLVWKPASLAFLAAGLHALRRVAAGRIAHDLECGEGEFLGSHCDGGTFHVADLRAIRSQGGPSRGFVYHAIHGDELDLQGHLDPTTVTVDEIQAILNFVIHDDNGH